MLLGLCLGICGSGMAALQSAGEEGYYQPQGRMVLIKSRFGYLHRMYIDCRGVGLPTVLIDVGIGEASANWFEVVSEVEQHTRICVYDRAGYGYSDRGPGERTTRQIVEELHDLLRTAEIPDPYVLVGHSFGGFTVRYFAARYPAETVGLVLVDSSHPDQVRRLAMLDTPEARAKGGNLKSSPVSRRDRSLTDADMNPGARLWERLNTSRKAVLTHMEELRYFRKSALQVDRSRLADQLPIAVLTRGIKQLPTINGIDLEDEWQDMQRDLVGLSENAWQERIQGAGHSLYRDAPGRISEQIIRIVSMDREYPP